MIPRPHERRPDDQAIVWQTGGSTGMRLLRAYYVRQSFPRHTHEEFVVCVNERGAHSSWYRGDTVIIPEGAVTVVPPSEVHTGGPVPGAPWHYRAVYVGAEVIEALAAEQGRASGLLPDVGSLCVADASLARSFVRAHRMSELDDDPLAREGLIVEVIQAILARHAIWERRRTGDVGPEHGLKRALEYIQDCYDGPITIDALARVAGLARHAVFRAFGESVGLTPYALVTQVRVNRAQQLLRDGVRTASVAYQVGFSDQSHLNRHFKRLVGATPAAFAVGMRCR